MIDSRLTKTDAAIIGALRRNSRMSLTEIVQIAGVSRTTVKSRLENLTESGRIRRFTIETDVDVEGEVKAITLIELQGSMSRKVTRALLSIPKVSTVYATNGKWDLVLEIKTDSLVGFDRVLRQIREVPGILNSESNLLLAHVAS